MKTVSKQQYTEIVKLFNSLTGARQLWELWEDAVILFATMLSNAVDKRFYDKREEMFRNVAGKYSEKEIQTFLQIFAEIVNQLEAEPEVDVNENISDTVRAALRGLHSRRDSGGVDRPGRGRYGGRRKGGKRR